MPERDLVFGAISGNADKSVEDAWRGSIAEAGIRWGVGPPSHDDATGRSHLEIGWAFEGEWGRIRGEKNQADEGHQGRHFDPPDGIADQVRSSRRDHRRHRERSAASLNPVQLQFKPLTPRSSRLIGSERRILSYASRKVAGTCESWIRAYQTGLLAVYASRRSPERREYAPFGPWRIPFQIQRSSPLAQ